MASLSPYRKNEFLYQALVCTVILFALASARALGEETPARASLLIGFLLPPEEAEAVSLRQGIELGVEQANQASGNKIGLVVRGRSGQWGADGEEAGRLVLNDGVLGMIAPPGGSPTHLALQVSGRTATPVITLCPDSSMIGAGIPWMVRIASGTIDEARTIFAAFPKGKSGIDSWDAVVPTQRTGREIGKDLRKAAMAVGAPLNEPVQIDTESTDSTQLAETIKTILSRKSGGILIWLDPEPAGRMAKRLRAAGFSGRLAGPGRLLCASFLATAGEAAKGVLMPFSILDTASQAVRDRFDAAYKARFGTKPDATAALAYDAAMLLADILRNAGEKPPRSAFPLSREWPGSTGKLKFRTNGERIVSLSLWEYQPGGVIPWVGNPPALTASRTNILDNRH